MRRTLFCAIATLFAAISSLIAAEPAPERCIRFDLDWMSPPASLSDSPGGVMQRMRDCMRLSSPPDRSSSYCWSLRYPVSIEQYPVLVVRYRAAAARSADQPVLLAELASSGVIVPIAAAADLATDGAVTELGKDLRPLADKAVVAGLRFTLPARAQLDIISLGFESAPGGPPVRVQNRRRMQLQITDEFDQPVAGAIVRAGALERDNWTSEGRTNIRGRVSLVVISPPGSDGTQAAEISVWRPGFDPVYLTGIGVRPSELFPVQLARADDPVLDGDPILASADQEGASESRLNADYLFDDLTSESGLYPLAGSRYGGGGGSPDANNGAWGETPGRSKLLSVGRYRVFSVARIGVSTATTGAYSPRAYDRIPIRHTNPVQIGSP